jgi:hypothetical protein
LHDRLDEPVVNPDREGFDAIARHRSGDHPHAPADTAETSGTGGPGLYGNVRYPFLLGSIVPMTRHVVFSA